MGNRAVITTRENFNNNGVGLYLHWNGGRDSVEAFLKYCELKGYRAPTTDCYGWARLAQVITNFFKGGLSVGINTVNRLDCDNYDNGVYIIDGWRIVDREYMRYGAEQSEHDLLEMLNFINERMPIHERLDKAMFTAKSKKTDKIKVGDIVFLVGEGDVEKEAVIGIGEDVVVNGHNVLGVPYVNRYGNKSPEKNINNYLFNDKYLVEK